MKRTFLIALLLVSLSQDSNADRFFMYGGFGRHNGETAVPEVNLENPLGTYGFGYYWTDTHWEIEYSHISALPQKEQGHGIDVIWIKKYLVIEF